MRVKISWHFCDFTFTVVTVVNPQKRTGIFFVPKNTKNSNRILAFVVHFSKCLCYLLINRNLRSSRVVITLVYRCEWTSGCKWCWMDLEDHQWCSTHRKVCPSRQSHMKVHQLHKLGKYYCHLAVDTIYNNPELKVIIRQYRISLLQVRVLYWNPYSSKSTSVSLLLLYYAVDCYWCINAISFHSCAWLRCC